MQSPQLRHMFGVDPAKAKKMEDAGESPAKRKADAKLAAAKRRHKKHKK